MLTAYRTDIGKVRLINEDRAAVQSGLNGLTLAIVADGMGGHQAGEIASQMAVDLIQTRLQHVHSDLNEEERKELLREAIVHANDTVYEFASNQERYKGMGTTVVAALASPRSILIGHVGDSRAYLITNRTIRQLTEDHSLVNELIRSGQITPEEASIHPRRNVVTRALGTDKQVDVDLTTVDWNAGDMLLLCSDGLSGLVGNAAILQVLHTERPLEWKVDALIRQAMDAGGDDNITVVLLENNESKEEKGG